MTASRRRKLVSGNEKAEHGNFETKQASVADGGDKAGQEDPADVVTDRAFSLSCRSVHRMVG